MHVCFGSKSPRILHIFILLHTRLLITNNVHFYDAKYLDFDLDPDPASDLDGNSALKYDGGDGENQFDAQHAIWIF